MSKCVKCDQFFHPDYVVIIDENTNAVSCVFCHTGNTSVTIRDEDSGEEKTVTKQEANRKYLIYLKELEENPNVKKILDGKVV